MRNHKGQFEPSTKVAEGTRAEERIQQLKSQLAYQYGKLEYTRGRGGREEKVQYHLDKIAYIKSRLEEFGVEV